jgi:hypothetical protein
MALQQFEMRIHWQRVMALKSRGSGIKHRNLKDFFKEKEDSEGSPGPST